MPWKRVVLHQLMVFQCDIFEMEMLVIVLNFCLRDFQDHSTLLCATYSGWLSLSLTRFMHIWCCVLLCLSLIHAWLMKMYRRTKSEKVLFIVACRVVWHLANEAYVSPFDCCPVKASSVHQYLPNQSYSFQSVQLRRGSCSRQFQVDMAAETMATTHYSIAVNCAIGILLWMGRAAFICLLLLTFIAVNFRQLGGAIVGTN